MNEQKANGSRAARGIRLLAVLLVAGVLAAGLPRLHAEATAGQSRQAMGGMSTTGLFEKTKTESGGESVRTLVPLGHTVGIKLFADGVMVVALSSVATGEGARTPAENCGIAKGDIITHVNGEKVESTEGLQAILQKAGGEPASVRVLRAGKVFQMTVAPVKADDGSYKLGVWIRDSIAGIGTLTFYDPSSGVFGALGHGINDMDTSLLMPLASGAIMSSTVKEVKQGKSGEPGELKGNFDLTCDIGRLYANTDCGIFGTMRECGLTRMNGALPVAERSEVKTGKATILSNVEGDAVKEYEIEITKVYPNSASTTRNMMIRVTDKELLQATGGIVQGMSGSPILQNGKLVGAVTHVLVNNPTEGYGIIIQNMLSEAFWEEKENAS